MLTRVVLYVVSPAIVPSITVYIKFKSLLFDAGRTGRTFFMTPRFSILIDGGFFSKYFRHENKRYPGADDVETIVFRLIENCPEVSEKELLRAFYYDASPILKKIKNPVTGTELNLGTTPLARETLRLHQALARKANFALRLGELKVFNWTATLDSKTHKLIPGTKTIETKLDDWKPAINQKGVDLRIGLDVAGMAFRKTVETIILFSGDTDLIPAMKLARKEGLRVITVIPDKGNLASSLIEHSDASVKISLKI